MVAAQVVFHVHEVVSAANFAATQNAFEVILEAVVEEIIDEGVAETFAANNQVESINDQAFKPALNHTAWIHNEPQGSENVGNIEWVEGANE